MTDINQDAQEKSSPSTLDAVIASSPEAQQQIEATQDTQPPTAEQGASQEPEVPFHKHPRFQELIEENRWLKQQVERSLQNNQPVPPQPQQPTQDPYASMTPEEERFYRLLDQRTEKIVQQRISQVGTVIEAGRMELAQMKVQQFRDQHPDLKPNSPEEIAIAEKIQFGYLPEDAYRAVMWNKKVVEIEKQANNQIKQKMEIKKQANVENRSTNNSYIPAQEKLTLRQRIERNAAKIEAGEL